MVYRAQCVCHFYNFLALIPDNLAVREWEYANTLPLIPFEFYLIFTEHFFTAFTRTRSSTFSWASLSSCLDQLVWFGLVCQLTAYLTEYVWCATRTRATIFMASPAYCVQYTSTLYIIRRPVVWLVNDRQSFSFTSRTIFICMRELMN